jgi:hypothetical protein
MSQFAHPYDLLDEREKIKQESVCSPWMRKERGMELMAHSMIVLL